MAILLMSVDMGFTGSSPDMCPFPRFVFLFPPSLQWVPWPPLAGALRFPTLTGTMGAYSGDVISTFRRDVNSHSDDVNKVGAQRRWGCNHATRFCQQSRGMIIHHHFVSVF